MSDGGRLPRLLAEFPALQPLSPAHLAGVADAFVTLVPDYFLSQFGARYLERTFWRTLCDEPDCFGFVWMNGDRVAGFSAGTIARDRFVGQVIRRAPLAFGARLMLAAARQPQTIADGFGLIRRLRAERAREGPDAELISLGVLPRELRPARVTAAAAGVHPVSPSLVLVAASAAAMADRGVTSFRLYTGATNHLACAFYRRLGFREVSRFGMFGEEKVGFIGEVAAPALSAITADAATTAS